MKWSHTDAEVMAANENDINIYYVNINKFHANLVVGIFNNVKYFKTHADIIGTDTLLSLPDYLMETPLN